MNDSPRAHGWPAVGALATLPDGRLATTVSTRRRPGQTAPAGIVARSLLGTKSVTIVAQGRNGGWITYATA